MRREDVWALRARMLREANNVASQGVKLADMTFSVEGDTLDALCRAWLELDSAPTGRRYLHSDDDWIVTPDEDGGVDHPYVRVRVVPVDGGDGDVDYWGSKPNGGEDDWTGYDG